MKSIDPYDYSSPLSRDNTVVCLIDRLNLYPSLRCDIEAAGARYGFSFFDLDDDPDPQLDPFLVRHIIIVDGHDCPETVTRRYESVLHRYTSATIALSYSDERRFQLASPAVDRLKREAAGRINYLLPSACERGYVPSLQKLIDNSICDSVRIKYTPLRRGSLSREELPAEVISFFSGVSALITRYGLYHRAPTDGFISVRSQRGGFFISCTRTDKCEMSLRRVAHVHDYSAESNVLAYSGNFLHSSDSVEAAIVYDSVPWLQAIVHTHASLLFTRNLNYRHKVAVPPSSYGQAGLGRDIATYVEHTRTRDFVILEDHGEFIFGTSPQPTECLNQIRDIVATASSRGEDTLGVRN